MDECTPSGGNEFYGRIGAARNWSVLLKAIKLYAKRVDQKIGANVVSDSRHVTFQLAEVAVPRSLFQKILGLIDDLRRRPVPA